MRKNIYTQLPWPQASPQYRFMELFDELITLISAERMKYWLKEFSVEQISIMLRGLSLRSKDIVLASLSEEKEEKIIEQLDSGKKVQSEIVIDTAIALFDKLTQGLYDPHKYWTEVGKTISL